MPEVIATFGILGAALLGLSVGLTACTVSCLPYMGTWVLGRAGGAGVALADAGAFVLGRVGGYAALGGAAGFAGAALAEGLEGIGGAVLGAGAILAALLLLRPEARGNCAVSRRPRLPPALMGAALALVPCPPLASLVAAAAASGSTGRGAALGLAFGLGAAVTPLLVVLPVLGGFAGSLRRQQPWLGRWLRLGGAVVLALIGARALAGALLAP